MINKLSFVIPVRDEENTLIELVERISHCVINHSVTYHFEIIFIDDGSVDNSWNVIESLTKLYPDVVGIKFRRNLGKSLALEAGFRAASGYFIFTMDADLQDDPKEIPYFLEKINQGCDMVSGYKKIRHDPITKTLPSKFFNFVTSKLTGINLKDFNCGFKCYRKEVIENIHLYGELHRFIPVLVADLGYKIGEVIIEHHPRRHGVSKYGFERYAKGFIDLITALSMTRWRRRPGHLFGSIGIFLGILGVLSLGFLFIMWIIGDSPIGNRPLLFFGVLTTLAALQMISLGIIAEFQVESRPVDLKMFISSYTGTKEINSIEIS